MADLAATAERLRIVQTAYQEFLQLWAIDCLMQSPDNRLLGDIKGAAEPAEAGRFSHLYREHHLDD